MSVFRAWFRLLDQNRAAYKGTDASSVMLQSDAVIDDFRDAVKLKYCDSHLCGIASSDLKVYKNIDKAKEEKEECLKGEDKISTMGLEEGNVFVVVMPSFIEKNSSSLVPGKRVSEMNPQFPILKKRKVKLGTKSWPATSDFKEIRFSELPYIDKTGIFLELFELRHAFISRPRRFGKSLLINTLNELFLGNVELFKGLQIEDSWDWKLQKYPVIKLDFGYFSSLLPGDFAEGLCSLLISEGMKYGIVLERIGKSFDEIFRQLVSLLSKMNENEGRDATFVILIDEYDKPIFDAFGSSALISHNLEVLRTFLQLIKASSPVFSLVTGTSRLARCSIFSGDNIRKDISFHSNFNSICGFSEDDIKSCLNLGTLSLEDLKLWYGGYCFGGNFPIFNPFSVISAINEQCIRPYWVDSGTTALLSKFCGTLTMKDFVEKCLLFSLDNKINISSILLSDDPTALGKSSESLKTLFLQSGYLTVVCDSDNPQLCSFRIPNKEIQDFALPRLMIAGICGQSVLESHVYFQAFAEAAHERDICKIYDSIMDLFQVIGYPNRGNIDKYEDYYQRILQAFFLAICPTVQIETCTSVGNSDLLADFGSWKVLFELKVLKGERLVNEGNDNLDKVIQNALSQALGKYATGLNPDAMCVLVFNSSTRTLYPRNAIHTPFFL